MERCPECRSESLCSAAPLDYTCQACGVQLQIPDIHRRCWWCGRWMKVRRPRPGGIYCGDYCADESRQSAMRSMSAAGRASGATRRAQRRNRRGK